MIPGPPGSGISLTDGNLTEKQPICSIKCPGSGTSCPTCNTCPTRPPTSPTHGVNLNLTYNSDNADGSRAQLDTGMGYGWTHSYNDFLFSQGGNLFRYDGNGNVTKYTRVGGATYIADTGYFQTLVRNFGGTYTIRDKYGTSFDYAYNPETSLLVGGPVYRLTSIVDRSGDSNTLTYTAGNLTSVSDTYGRSLTFAYNSSNKVVSVTDPLGRTATFMYDSTGRKLTTITDPEGKTTQYSYNFMYQMTEMVDRDGRTTRFMYAGEKPTLMVDSAFQKWFGLNNSTSWAMNTNELSQYQLRRYVPSTTTESDGRGNLWNYTYDSNGYITDAVAPDGATTSYTYDPATLGLASRTDPDGNTTTYQYDPMGNRTNMTDALGHVTSYTYETNFNQITSMTDPKGRVTTYQYDAHGNRISQIDPLGQTNSWSYDTNGNVLTETDKRANTTTYQYDSVGNLTNVTDAVGDVTSYVYDAVGNQISRTDANGHTTTYQYDSLNRLIEQIDPVGSIDQYAYDAQGDRTNVVDRDGDATMYQYDLRQRLVQATDALGHVSTSTYDANNNPTSMTDKNGHTTTYQYDVQNRPTQVTDALGNTTITAYDPVGNVGSLTDANGHVTTYTYDALNRRSTTTDAAGDVTQYQYDMGGSSGCPSCGATPGTSLVTGQTDANGKVTYYKYDDLDRLTNTVQKVGSTNDTITANDAVTTYTYDPNNNRVSLTEPDGNVTTYQYDSLNRQTNTVNAAGDVTGFGYDGVGNLTTNITPIGNVTVYTYDALDRRTNTVDSIGPVVSYTYDAVGDRLSQTDGNGNTTMNAYDAIHRPVITTDPLGKTTVTQYDPVGNVLMSTDRNGNTTTYIYDSINRRISMTDALGNTTQYQYDAVGNRIQLIDGNGHATQYTYDSVNRRIQETDADSTTRTYSYDGVGNLTDRTDQIGRTTTYTYDDLYRVTQRSYPSGTNDTFAYDLSGRMTNATRNAWAVTYAYDGANRLTNTTQNGKTIAYGFDIPGRTLTNTYPGGRTIIQRMDFRDRKTRIDDGASPPPIVQYTYDAANRVISRTNRNATVTTYSYNANNWTVSLEHSNATALIAGFGYAYDNEGNKQFEDKLPDLTHSECYGYDNIYRVTDYQVGSPDGSCVTGIVTQTQYGLDPVGNWLTNTVNGVPEIRMHNAVNELTQIGSTNLSYDANGNLINDAVYTYAYDEENRLTSVTRLSDAAVVGQYQYDAMGRRVQKVANPNGSPTTTRYFFDHARILEEQDGLGNTLATYVYGNYVDEALTMDRGGQTYYYHQNALWSVEAITDSTGTNVVERYSYDAYGAPTVTDASGLIVSTNSWGTAHSVITNSYLFIGRQLDEETGLYFYRARYYDSVKGRFLQRDPLGYMDPLKWFYQGRAYLVDVPYFRSRNPVPRDSQIVPGGGREIQLDTRGSRFNNAVLNDLNLYEYVQGKPTLYVDPYGLLPEACYRPIDGQEWMGDFAAFWHSFMKLSIHGAGQGWGIPNDESGVKGNTYCYEGVRQDTCECKKWTDDEIEDCLKKYAKGRSEEEYDIISNNCGQWVRRGFKKCCLQDPTPWWLVYG